MGEERFIVTIEKFTKCPGRYRLSRNRQSDNPQPNSMASIESHQFFCDSSDLSVIRKSFMFFSTSCSFEKNTK
jgi:hypothetical protein